MNNPAAVVILLLAAAVSAQPATRPGPPLSPPWIPPVAEVEPLPATAWKPRVFFDYNITPIFVKNPKWVNENGREPDRNGRFQHERNVEPAEYMLKSGAFIPAPIVYSGTLNQSGQWWDFERNDWEQNVRMTSNRWKLPTTTADGKPRHENYSDPMDPRAIRAVCQLWRRAYAFNAPVRAFRPMWLDIESTKTYNATDTTAGLVKSVRAYMRAADVFREYTNQMSNLELYTYGGQFWQYRPYLSEYDAQQKLEAATTDGERAKWKAEVENIREFIVLEREHAKRYSGFTLSAYNWDLLAEQGGDGFFNVLNTGDVVINLHYPQWRHNKVAFVTPYWQIYWPQNGLDPAALRAKAGKPVPIELWKKQIDYAVSRGWDLYMYVGTGDFDLTPIKAHVDYLLRFR
jgi:hypothetical protein